jgi:hypothetical protein
MTPTKKSKKKRLVRGKDFDAYAWKHKTEGFIGNTVRRLTEDEDTTGEYGKWVRVKFVEVDK